MIAQRHYASASGRLCVCGVVHDAAWRPAKPGETPGQMVPECTDPEQCTDPTCTHPAHLPDQVDTWTRDRGWHALDLPSDANCA